jgi:hypothetical protein
MLFIKIHNIIACWVGFCSWLDWMIGFIAIAVLHTFQFTVTHALGFSVFTSRILATELQQSRCHFKSQMESSLHSLIPFLPSFFNCQFRRLDSIQFQAHIPAGWRPETRPFTPDYCSMLLLCSVASSMSFYNPSARATQKTQPSLSMRRVYWSVSYQWTSFCCMHTLRGNVFTESSLSSGYIQSLRIARCVQQNYHNLFHNFLHLKWKHAGK